jgi:hypothetical protein
MLVLARKQVAAPAPPLARDASDAVYCLTGERQPATAAAVVVQIAQMRRRAAVTVDCRNANPVRERGWWRVAVLSPDPGSPKPCSLGVLRLAVRA